MVLYCVTFWWGYIACDTFWRGVISRAIILIWGGISRDIPPHLRKIARDISPRLLRFATPNDKKMKTLRFSEIFQHVCNVYIYNLHMMYIDNKSIHTSICEFLGLIWKTWPRSLRKMRYSTPFDANVNIGINSRLFVENLPNIPFCIWW